MDREKRSFTPTTRRLDRGEQPSPVWTPSEVDDEGRRLGSGPSSLKTSLQWSSHSKGTSEEEEEEGSSEDGSVSSEGNDEDEEDVDEDGALSGPAECRDVSLSLWKLEASQEDQEGSGADTTCGGKLWKDEELKRWSGGVWPVERPLPLPMWARKQFSAVTFSSVEEYEELASCMELQVQHLLKAHNYNTVGNFLKLYESFTTSDWNEQDLEGFFRKYKPPITPEHHTCVGLGLELMKMLSETFPHVKENLFLASCEETIEESERYVGLGGEPCQWTAEKEHVLVALKLNINGRRGMMLLDPGYHIARVITVMQDMQYPHTGLFTQMDEPHCKKEYCYTACCDGAYIIWKVRETRPIKACVDRAQGNETKKKVSEHLSLVYVGKPFLNPVSVTERRNLVYDFKSLLHRDAKGHLEAGLYFTLNQRNFQTAWFTIFHQQGGVKHLRKIPFSLFDSAQTQKKEGSRDDLEFVRDVGEDLGLSSEDFFTLLSQLATVMKDASFVEQVLSINNVINDIAANN
ncbi:hypothetical protein J437_LFUL008226 [Ladona fulva]|uniref:Uncharacterized protein n=1 Tax=Ladona fulva TaxID=123851 RepID=A0A8K0K4U3_LADFU|nr:hypothetical protein J437_LFUL008226 [Ladona fulva]